MQELNLFRRHTFHDFTEIKYLVMVLSVPTNRHRESAYINPKRHIAVCVLFNAC